MISKDDWDRYQATATAAIQEHTQSIVTYAQSLPTEAHFFSVFCAGVALGLLFPRLRQPFRRFLTVDDIPIGYFNTEKKITAVAVNITDGDTFRASHVPFWRSAGAIKGKMKLSENTLQIRLAGIDTPETPKFGHTGQPFGKEAKEWLQNTIDGRRLTLTLLHKDQYSRAVCMVEYGRWPFRKNVSEEILKVGYAQIYRQAGAVYGGRQDVFEKLELQAQKKKRGIWSQKNMETAAEYKARIKANK